MTCEQCKKYPATHRVSVGGLLSAWIRENEEKAVRVVCLVCLATGVKFEVNSSTFTVS